MPEPTNPLRVLIAATDPAWDLAPLTSRLRASPWAWQLSRVVVPADQPERPVAAALEMGAGALVLPAALETPTARLTAEAGEIAVMVVGTGGLGPPGRVVRCADLAEAAEQLIALAEAQDALIADATASYASAWRSRLDRQRRELEAAQAAVLAAAQAEPQGVTARSALTPVVVILAVVVAAMAALGLAGVLR